MYDSGRRVETNHLSGVEVTTGRDFWFGTVGSKALADRTDQTPATDPFPRWTGVRVEDATERTGTVFRNAGWTVTAAPAQPTVTLLNSTDRYTLTGRDRTARTTTDAAAPDVLDETVLVVRLDRGEVTATDLRLSGEVPVSGTVRVANDRTGRTDRTAKTLDDGYFMTPDIRYGTGTGKFHQWTDVTEGHREETTVFTPAGTTSTGEVRDKYFGGFDVNWGVHLETRQAPPASQPMIYVPPPPPVPLTANWERTPETGELPRRVWIEEGSGSSSGFLIASTTRGNGVLAAGNLSSEWREQHDVTSKYLTYDEWDRDGSKGKEKVITTAQDTTNDRVTSGSAFSAGEWRETSREFNLSHTTRQGESYYVKRTDPAGLGSQTREVEAWGRRMEFSRADGTAVSGSFHRGHEYESRRAVTLKTAFTNAATGESADSTSETGTTYFDRRSIIGDLVGLAELITSFKYENRTSSWTIATRDTRSPTLDGWSRTESRTSHEYSAEGSPSAGTRRVKDGGSYKFSWWQQPKPTGERTSMSMESPVGSGEERVTQWPMQPGWEDVGGLLFPIWTLAAEAVPVDAKAWLRTNAGDLGRIAFGFVDVGYGVGLMVGGGPVGVVIGFGLTAVGLDQIITGVWNIRKGKVGPGFSFLESLVYDVTGSETAAFLAPAVASLGLGWGTSLARMGSRTGPMLGIVGGDLRSVVEAGALAIVRGDRVIPVVWQTGDAFTSLVAALRSLNPGERLVVIGHGHTLTGQLVVGGQRMSAARLAEAIRLAGATPSSIELIACSLASSFNTIRFAGRTMPAASYAQQVAELIGVPVTAYRLPIYPRFRTMNGVTTVAYYDGVADGWVPILRFFRVLQGEYRPAFWWHTPATPTTFFSSGLGLPTYSPLMW